MKKKFIIICCSIISLILTLLISSGNIYSFKTLPTITTLMYMIIIFCLIFYVSMIGIYVISKKVKKEKIGLKKIISMLLFFASLIIIFGLILTINIDYLNWYSNSLPFYISVIIRCLEFLIPFVITTGIGIYLIKKK